MENAFGILASRFRVLLGIMEQRPKVVRDIVWTCVAQHVENTPRQTRQGTPADDIAAIPMETEVYVPDENHENHRNPMREAKHQQALLKDYFNNVSTLAGQNRI